MNPKADVHAVFTGAWDDPVKERAADTAVIDQGADVLGQQIDTPTTQIVAQERGVYGTGHNRDLREFAPKATLCSSSVGLGPLLRSGDQEDRGRQLDAGSVRIVPGHRRRRHRYRLLQQRRTEGRRRQGDGDARRDHQRHQAGLWRSACRSRRQGARRRRKSAGRRRPVEDGLVREGCRDPDTSVARGGGSTPSPSFAEVLPIMAPALELSGIRKSFGDFLALDDAHLSVEYGEVHALLGENGAGKSSLMNVAAGLYSPDAGSIRSPVSSAGFPARARRHASTASG